MNLTQLSCYVWGHHVDNHVFKQSTDRGRKCRCGTSYLTEDRSITRVRHTLSCFLGKHTYEKLADRDGCHEYVCTQCGHPLLFDAGHDPYAASPTFKKKVRYLCGLFGHKVRHVTTRDGFQEYACFCGHSFLQEVDKPKGLSPQEQSPQEQSPQELSSQDLSPQGLSLQGLPPQGPSPRGPKVIRHPAICVLSGHYIHFLTRRGGYAVRLY